MGLYKLIQNDLCYSVLIRNPGGARAMRVQGLHGAGASAWVVSATQDGQPTEVRPVLGGAIKLNCPAVSVTLVATSP